MPDIYEWRPYSMGNFVTNKNTKLVNKILNTYITINEEDILELSDVAYIKYQLLKKHDKQELIEMNDTEFKKELMEIIGA